MRATAHGSGLAWSFFFFRVGWPRDAHLLGPLAWWPERAHAVEFGTLIRENGKVVFRELSAEAITKLLKDADLDKKDDDAGRA